MYPSAAPQLPIVIPIPFLPPLLVFSTVACTIVLLVLPCPVAPACKEQIDIGPESPARSRTTTLLAIELTSWPSIPRPTTAAPWTRWTARSSTSAGAGSHVRIVWPVTSPAAGAQLYVTLLLAVIPSGGFDIRFPIPLFFYFLLLLLDLRLCIFPCILGIALRLHPAPLHARHRNVVSIFPPLPPFAYLVGRVRSCTRSTLQCLALG